MPAAPPEAGLALSFATASLSRAAQEVVTRAAKPVEKIAACALIRVGGRDGKRRTKPGVGLAEGSIHV
jgi:hypothetical protein